MEKGMKFFLDRYAQLGEKLPPKILLRQCLRVNTLRTPHEQLVSRIENLGVRLHRRYETRFGYEIVKSPFSLGATTEFLLGHYYLQGIAAQLPVEVLDPLPGEQVLDCCAAPGGKTTQLAQLMSNRGVIVALEKKSHRLKSLRNNLERCGITNTVVYHMDAAKAEKLGVQFDKVLLDAPCSGNYASEPDWFKKRSVQGIKQNARVQRKLLSAALSVLKPNGTLVYSTCSLEPEENELNMQWLYEEHGIHFEPINIPIGDRGLTSVFGKKLSGEIANTKRFWPHKTKTEGFYIAKIKKK